MKLTKRSLGLGLLACGLPWGCGSPGPPLPPSLELAQPVKDLRAVRKADNVYLTWSAPLETTDKKNIRHAGVTQVCRSLTPAPVTCNPPLTSIPPSGLPSTKKTTNKTEAHIDPLPRGLTWENPLATLRYAVKVLNSYGRTAGLSNQVSVPSAPTLGPPGGFNAEVERNGVRLSWDPVAHPTIPGLNFLYRVSRREDQAGSDQIVGELPVEGQGRVGVVDRNFEWEKTYQYRVTVVTVVSTSGVADRQVEGEDSGPKQVWAHDTFAPATPSGLEAAFSGSAARPFIDLVWTPDTEPDVAGYNVYRREQNTPAIKINKELVHVPAYRDSEIVPGARYFYSVSAVSVRGNESSRSEEASETIPLP